MIYKWKVNKYPVSAQVAGETLREIEEHEGCLTPEKIVEQSRAETAVLHGCFEWSNPKAAEEYRKMQAREILRHITIEHSEGEGEQAREVRAFWHIENDVSNDDKGRYISLNRALEDGEHFEYILKTALKELNSFKRKYAHLSELSSIFREIDKIEEQLKATV